METLGIILKGKNVGVFKNDNDEYCHICKFYIKNTQRIQIIFSKDFGDTATRSAINTTSEKKVLKLLKEENFKLL
jgi:hypothetical protein